ncbi:MAG TPA: flagellar basal body P-ring formation chaperone FlgA [bacterium]|nr:flagellar basal body P-ring formation chaperone FlgA [bacterium]
MDEFKMTSLMLSASVALVLLASTLCAEVVPQGKIESVVRQKIVNNTALKRENLNIEFIRVPKVSIPGKVCRIHVSRENSARELGRLSFLVTALGDGGVEKRYWVTANVSARATAVCAAQLLKAGSVVGPGDVLLREREIRGNFSKRPVLDVKLAVGKMLKRGVPKGKMLTTDMLYVPPTVKRRSVVRLEVRVRSLRITTLGKALKDGRAGDLIPVRNIASRRTVYGVVQEDGTVVVLVGSD